MTEQAKKVITKHRRRKRAHLRLRKRVIGTGKRPRLAVYKSLRFIYAQVIDDQTGRTLAQANSSEQGLWKAADGSPSSKTAARAVGETLAERAKSQGVETVVFDRGGFVYHGKVKEVAEGARSKGLVF
jgi:large subunit ribosomal protein L18